MGFVCNGINFEPEPLRKRMPNRIPIVRIAMAVINIVIGNSNGRK